MDNGRSRRMQGRVRGWIACVLPALGVAATVLAGSAFAAPDTPPPAVPDTLPRHAVAEPPAAAATPDSGAVPADGPPRAAGDAAPYFFYRGQSAGSMSLVHPLRMVVNGSYGILQLDHQDRHIWDFPYRHAAGNLWYNVRDPITAIRETGWTDFLLREILPFSTNTEDARYWPNYTQHLIGGGMSYRMIAEWYRWHGFAHPRAWSVGTMAVYHYWNEVIEMGEFDGYTTDPIADLMIFDPLGMVMFDHDGVARFFGETLQMSDWSYQPAYDPARRTLENNGQNFAIKFPLPWTDRWRVLYYYGTHGEVGLSRRWDGGTSLSFAGGFKASNLVDLGKGVKTVDLVPTFGLFYDVDNSLMASVLVSRSEDHRVRLNLYPGLFGRGFPAPGFFIAVGENRRVIGGITVGSLPHLPVGLGAELARGRDDPVAP